MSQTPTPRHELIQGEEREIGKSNLKVDFTKLQCHPTCEIIVEILKNHFIQRLLTASCSVPEVYMIQFRGSRMSVRTTKLLESVLTAGTYSFRWIHLGQYWVFLLKDPKTLRSFLDHLHCQS